MAEEVKHVYDRLASNYHLIFEDWDASIKRQAAVLGAILERECGAPRALRILDCACGIGTQTLGLAGLGFTVTACDISPVSVERTRVEAAKRRLNVQLYVADMLDLTEIPDSDFDAVMCMDNALPPFRTLIVTNSCFKRQRRFGENCAPVRPLWAASEITTSWFRKGLSCRRPLSIQTKGDDASFIRCGIGAMSVVMPSIFT
jgi:SAM-dependent methyltransferase